MSLRDGTGEERGLVRLARTPGNARTPSLRVPPPRQSFSPFDAVRLAMRMGWFMLAIEAWFMLTLRNSFTVCEPA
jgi:hypothetical protein